jgi:hypothetical protein
MKRWIYVEREIYDRLLKEGFRKEDLGNLGIDKLTPD